MIRVENLTKRFGHVTAVDDLSFEVSRGEVVGFLGPNGAGKTTTMRIVTGFIPATEGRVSVGGHDVFDEPLASKRCVGYLPESVPVYDDMEVDAEPVAMRESASRSRGIRRLRRTVPHRPRGFVAGHRTKSEGIAPLLGFLASWCFPAKPASACAARARRAA